MTAYMPDGRPAPLVLTGAEVIAILRMNVTDKSRDRTLYNLRREGLKSFKRSTEIVYPLSSVVEFMEKMVDEKAR